MSGVAVTSACLFLFECRSDQKKGERLMARNGRCKGMVWSFIWGPKECSLYKRVNDMKTDVRVFDDGICKYEDEHGTVCLLANDWQGGYLTMIRIASSHHNGLGN